MTIITSPHNERIKLVRALQNQGKVRRREGQIALEGVRLISDALIMGTTPDFVIYTPEMTNEPLLSLLDNLREHGITCLEVIPAVMAEVADTQSPQGVIAVVPMPTLTIPTMLHLLLILDGVADPGNMGTILRTAAAASVDMVILAPGCVDPFNPKVLRSGMGAHFRIPILHKRWPEIAADHADLPLYLADTSGTMPYYQVDWRQPAGLIIGGEARGADDQARHLATATIAIPMANAAESLNAAMATAVILFESRRQYLVGP